MNIRSLFYKSKIYYEMSFTENGSTLKYKESIDASRFNHYWWWHQLKDQTLLWAKEVYEPNKIGKLFGMKQIIGSDLPIDRYN